MGTNEELGELVLLIGDFHIPARRPSIPKQFKELLQTDKIRYVLCTGNIGSESVADMLRRTAPAVFIVAGDAETKNDYPESEVIQIGEFKVGLINGHQALGNFDLLAAWQRKLDCDVLVFGSTHRNSAEKVRGKFYINPGSATGAYRPRIASEAEGPVVVPSFMLMSIKGKTAILYVYELRDGKVNVSKSDLTANDLTD